MNKHRIESARNAEHKSTLKNWLHLRHTPGLGDLTFHTLLDVFGTVEAIFNANHKQLSA
ncbi:MAG: hypothetical protein GQ573_08640, partial [Gammaproteobacteria bacterium]|nr:hypothetical protein [Gammaproteobacteria bacterium]